MSNYINKDGKVNTKYTQKLWNHVTETNIDSSNGILTDEVLLKRINQFKAMLNKLIKEKTK